MKRTLVFFVSLTLVILSLCACTTYKDRIIGTPMLKVILKQSYEENDKQFLYIVVVNWDGEW